MSDKACTIGCLAIVLFIVLVALLLAINHCVC